MIGEEIVEFIKKSLVIARDNQHKFVTVEHMLLVLLDDVNISQALNYCGADIAQLRSELATYLATKIPMVEITKKLTPQTITLFDLVLLDAVMHSVRAKREVTGLDLLRSIFVARNSHAVFCLEQHRVSQEYVLSCIARVH